MHRSTTRYQRTKVLRANPPIVDDDGDMQILINAPGSRFWCRHSPGESSIYIFPNLFWIVPLRLRPIILQHSSIYTHS